jgi:hypothetical protein
MFKQIIFIIIVVGLVLGLGFGFRPWLIGQFGGGDQICAEDVPQDRYHYNPDNYRSTSGAITKPTITVPEPSSLSGQRSYPAPYPRATPATVEPSEAVEGTTFYADPKDMTPDQLIMFQNRAKFENMTLADYQNWLSTFALTPQKLTGFHRSNLKVLLRGGKLSPSDMPTRSKVPDTASDQYTKIMHDSLPEIPHPEFLGYQPYNYEDVEPNIQNRDLRHLDFINPDEPLKTWILTREPPSSKK